MATETQSFVEQVKEMRAMRIQQLRQMNAEQRFQASMINYQRSMLRSNEKLITSISNLGNKITSTITGLVGAIGKAGKATVGAAAGGVVSLSDSIVSGLAKALPYALIGLVGKIMIWDNMSSESKSRLTSSFGRLFGKLFSGVENMFDGLMAGVFKTIESIKKGFKELNIKFPFFETLFKKAGIVFEIITEGLKVVTAYIEKLVDFVKENPMTSAALATGAYMSPQIIGVVSSLVSSVLTYLVVRGALTRHMNTLLGVAATQLGTRLGGGALTGAGERALATRLGPAGAATLSEKMGINLAEHVYMGEGGQPILSAEGKAIARVAPEMTKGQRFMSGMRAFGSKALQVGARFTNIVGIGLLAIEPQGGWTGADERDYEQFEMELRTTAGLESSKRKRWYASNAYPNMFKAFCQGLVDAYNERVKSNGAVYPGDVVMMSNRFYWRVRGTNESDPFKRTSAVSIFNMKVDGQEISVIEVIPVDRAKFEKQLEDEADAIEKKTQNDMRLIDEAMNPNKGEVRREPLSASKSNIAGLAEIVQRYESAPAGYNQLFLGAGGKPYVETSKPLTQMTVAEIRDVQARQVAETKKAGIGIDPKTGKPRGTGAIGKYQFTQGTLAKLLKDLGIKEDAIFDEALQDRLFVKLIGDDYLLYLKGELTKEQFIDKLKGTWEGFRGPKAVKELDKFLEVAKKEFKEEDKVLNLDGVYVVDEKGQRVKGADLVIKRGTERIQKLMKELEGMESLADKPLMTMDGENVVEVVKQKAIDYYEERKKAIKERMMENEPETLKSQLLDTLKITRDLMDVKNAKDGMDVPHSTVINNTTNNNTSGGSSGKSVRADGLRDTEFKTITGVFP